MSAEWYDEKGWPFEDDPAFATGRHYGIEGFTPFRGRSLAGARSVEVYRNLHEQRRTGAVRWSIRDADTHLVLGHADKLAIEGASVHVNTAAQQRIRDGAFRTVHAWLSGRLAFCPTDASPWYGHAQQVTYRPTESPLFRFIESDAVFISGPLVRFDEHGMWTWL